MGSILFEHNQKAYVAAAEMMAQTGKAAIIHPTGTGKSFIAFQLCADYPEKKVCLLSPSEYIFTTQMEKWRLVGGAELKNIQFITYARLMRMEECAMAEIRPDYIVLDEFHRCGATQWGGGVERLRAMFPGAKVLGLSATNVRYLDNRRDMAWELFDGNIASELTLGAAVAHGILPAPKYILSVYSYQKELKRYEMRVQQARNKAVRDQAEKELEALRRALEKADGLPEVFARHMQARRMENESSGNTDAAKPAGNRNGAGAVKNAKDFGKYIVFCANYEHLLKMQELATEWFAKVDSAPHIYTAYADDPATSEEFAAFKADTSNHLKLLYCIDMLNEGIHVDGIDGVILLRPTVSPTIYKQQIGRALATGGKGIPVIFDIVMNIENLCSIGAIEEELLGAVSFCRMNGREGEIVNEHFRVIDELGDCRKLFRQLNETLGASWEAMYAMAREYYRAHGNLEVSKRYTTPESYSLGAWLDTQRKVYAGKVAGNLGEAQIKKLSEIGMRWQGVWEWTWEKSYAAACEYYKEHGNLAVPSTYVTKEGCLLGRWIRRQREVYRDAKRKTLNAERIRRLEQIGMIWENGDSWEYRFSLAKKYYEEHGNLDLPANYIEEGIWLGRWLREQKARLREDSDKFFTPQQREKLSSLGLQGGATQAELAWRRQYGEAEEFYREHGNLAIPKRYIAKSGKSLGIWLQHQRTSRRSGQLTGEQVALLDRIGMVWNPDAPWKVGLRHAREYFQETGHLAVPNNYVCEDGYRLGKWISNQRCAYRGALGKGLEKEQIRQLEEIGMVWSAKPGRHAVEVCVK